MSEETPPLPADEPAATAEAPVAASVPDAPDAPDASGAADLPAPEADAAPAAVPAAPTLPELSPAACAAQLAERFPALFGAGRALPIKLRIQADIQERAPGVFTRKVMSLFLHRHTTTTAYLKALVASPHRFDLDGAPAGEVLPEHREAATVELERRRGIVDARRAAERDAQRQAFNAQRDQVRNEAREQARRQQAEARAAAQAAQAAQAATAAAAPAALSAPAAPAPLSAPHVTNPAQPLLSAADLEARRERAALLRAFDGSTLTRANFCALKRITEAELEAQLVLARQEREQRPPEPRPERNEARTDARRDPRSPRRDGPRSEPRGPGSPQGKPRFKPPGR